jgi:hypothetical protein
MVSGDEKGEMAVLADSISDTSDGWQMDGSELHVSVRTFVPGAPLELDKNEVRGRRVGTLGDNQANLPFPSFL